MLRLLVLCQTPQAPNELHSRIFLTAWLFGSIFSKVSLTFMSYGFLRFENAERLKSLMLTARPICQVGVVTSHFVDIYSWRKLTDEERKIRSLEAVDSYMKRQALLDLRKVWWFTFIHEILIRIMTIYYTGLGVLRRSRFGEVVSSISSSAWP
jgi:hypothetical protein